MAGVLLVFYLDGFVLGAPVALLLVWALQLNHLQVWSRLLLGVPILLLL